MRVACDTPLGIEFATLQSKGNGVLVVERIVEAFATARGWKPDECELLVVDDAVTGRQIWTQHTP
jgi:hypothetical protein